MDHDPRQAPVERDRSVSQLRSIGRGTTAVGLAALVGIATIAAISDPGSSTTNGPSTPTDDPSTQQAPTIQQPTSPQQQTAPFADPFTAPQPTLRAPHVRSGGSH